MNDKKNTSTNNKPNTASNYFADDSGLYRSKNDCAVQIANYHIIITEDNSDLQQNLAHTNRKYAVDIHLKGKKTSLVLSQNIIEKNQIGHVIQRACGSEAILYGSSKDLWNAAQEISACVQKKSFSQDNGFDYTGTVYKSGSISITAQGITAHPEKLVILPEKGPAKNIEFIFSDRETAQSIACHLCEDFLSLKSSSIMYPLIGHITLAPFSSVIKNITSKSKYALHILGPSGCGKTFASMLLMAFFGAFDDPLIAWASTANAIELLGQNFKDSLYFIDDYKGISVDQRQAVGVIQRYVEETSRMRLKPDLSVHNKQYIRGLILSTGEDYISNTASVTGRSIIIKMDGTKNIPSGERCWNFRAQYRGFLPWVIHYTLSNPAWRDDCKIFVDNTTSSFLQQIPDLSNGLRIAGNWALNAWGFELFLQTLLQLEVITAEQKNHVTRAYEKIVKEHIAEHAIELLHQNPVALFFNIITERLALREISISGLTGEEAAKTGLPVGRVAEAEGKPTICLYINKVIPLLFKHFQSLGQKAPFTATSLRDALAHENLLIKSSPKRWTRQVREPAENGEGERIQCWEFDADKFKNYCGLAGISSIPRV
jgi:hypothetical protein